MMRNKSLHIPTAVVLAIMDRFDQSIRRKTTLQLTDNQLIIDNTYYMSQDPNVTPVYVMEVVNDNIERTVTIHTRRPAEPTIKFRYDGTLVED